MTPDDRPNELPPDGPAEGERCDHCGSEQLVWRRCKLMCGRCRQVVKSCADL